MLAPRGKSAKWLILVYMAGDNDLEGFALKDILELQKIGSSDDVYIFVQIDRAKGHDPSHGDWQSTRRYFIRKDEGEAISSEFEDIGETNTGDPSVLAEFIRRGVELYPAERHGLVIWNHGTGWKEEDIYRMAAEDRVISREKMRSSVSELQERQPLFRKALTFSPVYDPETKAIALDDGACDFLDNEELARALFAGNVCLKKKFDFVGFDACLMNMLEVYYQIRDFANVIVGSEEVEPADGWPYTDVLRYLTKNPDADVEDIGVAIVDSYVESYRSSGERKLVTQSCLSSQAADGLVAAVGRLALKLIDLLSDSKRRKDAWFKLMSAYQKTTMFRGKEYLDLGSLLMNIEVELTSLNISSEVQEALREVSNVVLHQRAMMAGGDVNVSGISIYWPMAGLRYSTHYDHLDFCQATTWNDFLKAYLFFRP
jgi:hypothetical protein